MPDQPPVNFASGLMQVAASPPPLQISPRANGDYAVINPSTGQTVYVGTLAGARQAQAQGVKAINLSRE